LQAVTIAPVGQRLSLLVDQSQRDRFSSRELLVDPDPAEAAQGELGALVRDLHVERQRATIQTLGGGRKRALPTQRPVTGGKSAGGCHQGEHRNDDNEDG
jgi:hypothetical protein